MKAFHEDTGFFRDAVIFTQEQTGFSARLIEKDYFCTLLLDYLAAAHPKLVFKGGTCLAKVHANFYRLSEDLDFMIPTALDSTRPQRSRSAADLKGAFAELPQRLPGFRMIEPLTGANNSSQYNAVVGYTGIASGQEDTIKVEVALREPLLRPALNGSAQTLLRDPITRLAALPSVQVRCISRIEAYAEKFRAAASRREVAVRDFFDLDYVVRKTELQVNDPQLIGLVRLKLAVPGNDPVDVSARRLTELRRQVVSQLRPVLRTGDFVEFDVERAFRVVVDMATKAIGP